MTMARRRYPTQALSLLALLTARAAADTLPYNPTQLFLSQTDDRNLVYIFTPDSDSTTQAKLLSLDLSSDLDSSSISPTTLYPSLPFLDSASSRAYTPLLDESGNITALVGDCSTGATGAAFWRFQPSAHSQTGNGTWTQETLEPHNLGSDSQSAGANWLAAGLAFSETVGGGLEDTSMYIFGGMCPTEDATSSTWTSAANYSRLLVTMTPEDASEAPTDYQLGLTSSRGPPIAEAGFGVVPLPAAYGSNSSGTQSQQQTFLLVGGHTQTAFINMSQVALFSLPQESWTFMGIDQPSEQEVEPRSGHTAVLSEDGKTVVVLGGWVGDVTTAATPQLAILELGSGYGGDGDWAWTIPDQSSVNFLAGAGLYGHGAVMLPGGIMMVYGGYSISASSTSRMFRRASQTSSTQTLFYNVSSNTWLSTYTPSSSSSTTSGTTTAQKEKSGALASSSQKAGLAVGLILGFFIILCLILFYFWYTRKLGRRRAVRESDMKQLVHPSQDLDTSYHGAHGKNEIETGHGLGHNGDGDGDDPYGPDLWDDRDRAAHPWLPPPTNLPGWKTDAAKAREVERTGLFVNIPSPTRGLRRSVTGRASTSTSQSYNYHAAPRYEDGLVSGRLSRASGTIHPIVECEEEVSPIDEHASDAERKLKGIEKILTQGQAGGEEQHNPFLDPEQPVSPITEYSDGVRRVPTNSRNARPNVYRMSTRDNMLNWVSSWSAASSSGSGSGSGNGIADLHSSGRLSPSKTDERTSSTLSEQSTRSGLSISASLARTGSTHSGTVFGASGAPVISPETSPTRAMFGGDVGGVGRRTPSVQHGRRSPFFGSGPSARRSNTIANHTGYGYGPESPTHGGGANRTSFLGLQHESDTLLGASQSVRVNRTRPGYGHRHQPSDASTAELLANAGPAPAIPPRRRLGWMGSLRRALNVSVGSERSMSLHRPGDEGVTVYDRSASSSPIKNSGYTGLSMGGAGERLNGPRRTVSDGSALLRHKRGKSDWDGDIADGERIWKPYRDSPELDAGDWGDTPVTEHPNPFSDLHQPYSDTPGPNEDTAPDKAGDEDEDWDVEMEAAKRDVQVMFTVPKARLRVVNASESDRDSIRSLSDGGMSLTGTSGVGRSGSVRTLGSRLDRGPSGRSVRSTRGGMNRARSTKEKEGVQVRDMLVEVEEKEKEEAGNRTADEEDKVKMI